MLGFLGLKRNRVCNYLEVPKLHSIGKDSVGEFFSVALTSNKQEADTGAKMIHLAPGQKVELFQGISAGQSKNTYRGLVKIGPSF